MSRRAQTQLARFRTSCCAPSPAGLLMELGPVQQDVSENDRWAAPLALGTPAAPVVVRRGCLCAMLVIEAIRLTHRLEPAVETIPGDGRIARWPDAGMAMAHPADAAGCGQGQHWRHATRDDPRAASSDLKRPQAASSGFGRPVGDRSARNARRLALADPCAGTGPHGAPGPLY
jgi:hypothetical protein